MTSAALEAIGICAAAAALEGLFAGRGVRRRLAELRQPRRSPPLAVWIVIGLGYYLICFVVLSRLMRLPRSALREAAVGLLLALLIGNALWNLVFFRLKNVEASAIAFAAYLTIALMLAVLLERVDPVSGWVFLPYLLYLAYAAWWLRSLRKLNKDGEGEAA